MEYSEQYLHLGEEIDIDDYVICEYRVTTDMPMPQAAAAIATEQSTGTWTKISTLKEDVFEKYSGRVISIEGDRTSIAFPNEIFSIENGGVPQILSVIAGNLFGLEALKGVRLEDVHFPPSILEQFPGPRFGIEGLRDVLKRPKKPLVGTIVKPKVGLSPKDTASYIYEAGKGGLTNGKDDETLVDQVFCPIEDRTVAIAESLDRLKEEGHLMVHAINVSTCGHKIVELAEKAQEWGANQIMLDVLTCGFAAVQALRDDPSIKVPIHVHRTMHAAITRDPLHGIAMKPMVKLVRMCGGDGLHIGTFGVGKMKGLHHEELGNLDACIGEDLPYKSMMPVCSGGLHAGMIEALVKIVGLDLQVQAGGGVSGHPGGVRGGAMAMSQAVDAVTEGISLPEYAKTHKELAQSLDKWGYV